MNESIQKALKAIEKKKVTRAHRELAYVLVEEANYENCCPDGRSYIDGLPTEGEYSWEDRIAQAIADAEERGFYKAKETKPAFQLHDLLRALSVGQVYELARDLHGLLGCQARYNALRDGLGK